MKSKRFYIAYLLLCVSLVMLIAAVIPHHHHQGYFCIQNDLQQCSSQGASEHGGCMDCKSCCITNFQCSIPTDDDTQANISIRYSFESLLFTFTSFLSLPDREGAERIKNYFCYLEKLHATYISNAVGLRAPPFAAI